MVLSIQKLPSLAQCSNAIMFLHLINQFPLCYLSSSGLQQVKSKRKFKTFGSKSRRGCLREVVVSIDSKYADLT